MRRGRYQTRSRNTERYAPYGPRYEISRRRQQHGSPRQQQEFPRQQQEFPRQQQEFQRQQQGYPVPQQRSPRQQQEFPRQQQEFQRQQQGYPVPQQRSPRQQQEFQRQQQASPRQQLPDPMTVWIDPRLGSESQRMDLAAVLIKIIVDLNGKTTLPCLENELFQKCNWKFADWEYGLRHFIEDFRHVFILHKNGDLGEDTISCNLVLDICPTHISNAGTCREDCEALHVCKFYLLSKCHIEDCKFGHNLESDHNWDVLKRRLVNKLSTFDIRGIFRKLSNRHGPTIPSVCTYFNAKGCKINPCPFLHICQHYIDGDCKFGFRCKRSHNIHGDQPSQLLIKYGLQNQRIDQLLTLIKEAKTTASVSTTMPTIKPKYDKSSRRYLVAGSKVQSRDVWGMFVNGPNNSTVNGGMKLQDGAVNPKYVGRCPNFIKKDDNKTVNNIFNGDTDKLSPTVPTKESSDGTSTSSNSSTCSNIENKDDENKLPNSQLPENGSNDDTDVGSTVLQTIQFIKDESMDVPLNVDNSQRNEENNGVAHDGEIQSKGTCDNYETTSWQFTEDGKTNENDIPESERKKIEQKYQQYLVAKEHYITIDDTAYKIDFSAMEGIPYEKDKAKITVVRCVRNVQTEKTSAM